MKLALLLLAAGASRRYGDVKALANCGDTHLLGWTLRQLRPLGEVTVVLGAHADRVRSALPGDVRCVVAENWQQGQAHSVHAGLRALPETASAVLIALLDQPAILSAHYTALLALWRKQPECIAAATYSGRLGAPAIFPRAFWPQLFALSGDQGARLLLQTLPVQSLAIPEAAHDIDTPEDWRSLTTVFH